MQFDIEQMKKLTMFPSISSISFSVSSLLIGSMVERDYQHIERHDFEKLITCIVVEYQLYLYLLVHLRVNDNL